MERFDGAIFELCEQTDKLTDKQTDILITIFRNPPRGHASRRLETLNYFGGGERVHGSHIYVCGIAEIRQVRCHARQIVTAGLCTLK